MWVPSEPWEAGAPAAPEHRLHAPQQSEPLSSGSSGNGDLLSEQAAAGGASFCVGVGVELTLISLSFSSYCFSLQKLPGQASGGEENMPHLRQHHTSITPAAIHQLRSHHAGHCVQIGAETARGWVQQQNTLYLADYIRYILYDVVFPSLQMNRAENVTSTRAATCHAPRI